VIRREETASKAVSTHSQTANNIEATNCEPDTPAVCIRTWPGDASKWATGWI